MTAPADFSPLEYKLYGRQMILPELGQAGQQKLKDAKVAVIGAGGLGAPALLYLAGAGVGTVVLIDDDEVEISNLHRQVIHSFARVGTAKADSAAQTMRELNPTIRVQVFKERLTDANADSLLQGATVLMDGSDNFATRYAASRAAARAGIPHVWGAILGFDAQMSVFWRDQAPVYEDLYPVEPAPGSVPNCATAGVIGALAGVVGTSMAMETIKLITGVGQPLTGQVGYYTGLTGRWEYIPLVALPREPAKASKAPEPKLDKRPTLDEPQNATQGLVRDASQTTTQQPKNLSDISNIFRVGEASPYGLDITFDDYFDSGDFAGVPLIDVREPHEFEALSIPGAINLPLSVIESVGENRSIDQEIERVLLEKQAAYALYCAAGVRSRTAAQKLLTLGYGNLYSLEGGLSAWLAR
ncbi:ThiF family adenylyltransferase [Rothia endophytica]|uniref:ThiF family adenylyltransferase n=1 Tax=Rothia endophytica TaxID=1324766 RepID=A0ABP9B2M2_9MICC